MKLFSTQDAWSVLRSLRAQGVVCVPGCLSEKERRGLLKELKVYTLARAPTLLGEYGVRQDFFSFRDFPPGSRFLTVRDELEARLNSLCSFVEAKRKIKILSTPLRFNDLVVQRYDPTAEGISPHRDGKSRINLIALLMLEGEGRFCVCDDRTGSNMRPVRNKPGDLLLMRGPGFFGEEVQPFHCVSSIETRRSTFGLRHKEIQR